MLLEKAKEKQRVDAKDLYLKFMKKIDTLDNDIIVSAAKGHQYQPIFYEKDPTLKYTNFFENYYCEPYNKSIMNTLREKYPEFICYNEHVYYSTQDFMEPNNLDVHYHRVCVSWKKEEECKCILI